jgi:hypothetical protein
MIATPTRTLSTMKNTQKRCMKQVFDMPGTTLLETNVCIARYARVAIGLETALHTIASSFGVYYHQMYLPRLNAPLQSPLYPNLQLLKGKQIDPHLLGIIAVTPHVKNQKESMLSCHQTKSARAANVTHCAQAVSLNSYSKPSLAIHSRNRATPARAACSASVCTPNGSL